MPVGCDRQDGLNPFRFCLANAKNTAKILLERKRRSRTDGRCLLGVVWVGGDRVIEAMGDRWEVESDGLTRCCCQVPTPPATFIFLFVWNTRRREIREQKQAPNADNVISFSNLRQSDSLTVFASSQLCYPVVAAWKDARNCPASDQRLQK